jgi:hypothetical protein
LSLSLGLNHNFGRGLVNKKHDTFDHDHDHGHCLTSHQNFTYLDICPKCRRKIKENKEIEVEIDLDELESIQEIYRERIFCRCCCMWISINNEDRMHYICDCGKMREY